MDKDGNEDDEDDEAASRDRRRRIAREERSRANFDDAYVLRSYERL